jgi:AcrR family transcriptional regulator
MTSSERFPRRAEAARATRRRVLAAATSLFTTQGYGATSIVAIAAAADVAEQTIYAAFGNKRSVLAEALDVAIVGDDEPLTVNERDWMKEVLATTEPADRLRRYAVAVRHIHGRAAAMFHVLEVAADGDPDLQPLRQETLDRRRIGAVTIMGPIAESGGLRPGLDLDHAADVVWTMNSPEVYLNLVEKRRWAPEQYESWLGDALVSLLLTG